MVCQRKKSATFLFLKLPRHLFAMKKSTYFIAGIQRALQGHPRCVSRSGLLTGTSKVWTFQVRVCLLRVMFRFLFFIRKVCIVLLSQIAIQACLANVSTEGPISCPLTSRPPSDIEQYLQCHLQPIGFPSDKQTTVPRTSRPLRMSVFYITTTKATWRLCTCFGLGHRH